VDDGKQGRIKLLLKYDERMRNAIQGIERISTPGLRQYRRAANVPRVLNGLGIAIVSTSKGVMTDRECRKGNVGGEVIGKVW
jgi:small subunit ribosomal protein S8